MSLRGLIVLILLLAGAAALVAFLKPKPEAPAAAAEIALVAPFSEASLGRVEIACSDTSLTLTREGPSGWRLAAPIAADADPRAVHTLVGALQDARVRKVIAATAPDRIAYGLAPPACRVTLAVTGETVPRVLDIGRTSPVGTERYALDAKGQVVLVDGALYSGVARTPEALREKRLVPVPPEDVTGLELTRPDGSLLLVRDGDRWTLEAPVRDLAAGEACSQLIRALTSMELGDIRSAPLPAAARPDRTLRLVVRAKGRTAPIEALVAAAGVSGQRLALRDGGAFAGLLPEASASELSRPFDAFRDRRVASFSLDEARSVAVTRGDATLRIERAKEGAPWTLRENDAPGVPGDEARVDAFLERVRSVAATGFEPETPRTRGTGTLIVRGASAELARLSWGTLPPRPDKIESVWLTTPSRPGVVFRIEASQFGPIPAKASELKGP